MWVRSLLLYFFSAFLLLEVSCSENKQQKVQRSGSEKTIVTSDSCDIYFYYDADTVTWEDDDHVLYSPIIEMHKEGKWNDYRLRQLDSMIEFVKKHDVNTMSIHVMNFNSYEWGTENDIVAFIQKKIDKTKLKYLKTRANFHNPYPFWACSIYDSMSIKQNRDSIYYIALFKLTPR